MTGYDGAKYEGDWKNGRKGSKFEGEWKDGERHGRITVTDPHGETDTIWYCDGREDTARTKEERDAREQRAAAAAGSARQATLKLALPRTTRALGTRRRIARSGSDKRPLAPVCSLA